MMSEKISKNVFTVSKQLKDAFAELGRAEAAMAEYEQVHIKAMTAQLHGLRHIRDNVWKLAAKELKLDVQTTMYTYDPMSNSIRIAGSK